MCSCGAWHHHVSSDDGSRLFLLYFPTWLHNAKTQKTSVKQIDCVFHRGGFHQWRLKSELRKSVHDNLCLWLIGTNYTVTNIKIHFQGRVHIYMYAQILGSWSLWQQNFLWWYLIISSWLLQFFNQIQKYESVQCAEHKVPHYSQVHRPLQNCGS